MRNAGPLDEGGVLNPAACLLEGGVGGTHDGSLLPIRLVSDEFTSGTLVDVLPGCDVPDRPLYALYAPGGQTLARVRLFLDFVPDWFRRQASGQNPQQKASVNESSRSSFTQPAASMLPASKRLTS